MPEENPRERPPRRKVPIVSPKPIRKHVSTTHKHRQFFELYPDGFTQTIPFNPSSSPPPPPLSLFSLSQMVEHLRSEVELLKSIPQPIEEEDDDDDDDEAETDFSPFTPQDFFQPAMYFTSQPPSRKKKK